VTEQSVAEGIFHSRKWHAAFDLIQFGPVPVIAVLHGAVVSGRLELARRIAGNAPLSNYAITQALPRIAEMAPAEGLFVESLM
jgi:enoyl-CoA hydratase/carnithine racemase